ncbi:hypothetical protein [Mobiluncus sp.]|uniref:hypothetical protein n=1 Tax=Mobiluncus sp. TaxID=47293 RepID=UPI002A91789D|nr:hypothetical protein [Mobiluncus sp.]MDY6076830.1 hypothetical protein [Mobiluncus sp.]
MTELIASEALSSSPMTSLACAVKVVACAADFAAVAALVEISVTALRICSVEVATSPIWVLTSLALPATEATVSLAAPAKTELGKSVF